MVFAVVNFCSVSFVDSVYVSIGFLGFIGFCSVGFRTLCPCMQLCCFIMIFDIGIASIFCYS